MTRKDHTKPKGEIHHEGEHPIIIRIDLKIKSFEQVPDLDYIKIHGWNGFSQTVLDVNDIQRLWVLQLFKKQKGGEKKDG